METNTLLQAISSVGFPIIMCIGLLYYVREMTSEHKSETEKFTEALNENTLVLQKLCDNLGVERHGNNE